MWVECSSAPNELLSNFEIMVLYEYFRMGEGLAGIEPISCYTCIQRTVDNIPGNIALVSGDR